METIQTENFSNNELLVDSELFHNRVDIVRELQAISTQEHCSDEHENDLLYQSYLYIEHLRSEIERLEDTLESTLSEAW